MTSWILDNISNVILCIWQPYCPCGKSKCDNKIIISWNFAKGRSLDNLKFETRRYMLKHNMKQVSISDCHVFHVHQSTKITIIKIIVIYHGWLFKHYKIDVYILYMINDHQRVYSQYLFYWRQVYKLQNGNYIINTECTLGYE